MENEKHDVREKTYNGREAYLKWGVALLIVILIFSFFAFYAKQFGKTSLNVDLKGKTVSIETEQLRVPSEQASKFDPKRNYIDSARSFSFELPLTKSWSKPIQFSGMKSFLEAKGMSFTPEIQAMMTRNSAINPLGSMIENVEGIRITSGDTLNVEVTNETSNELLDEVIENVRKRSQEEGVTLSDQDLLDIRRQAIGIERGNFTNEYIISIYDKSKVKATPIKLSLPNFFVALSSGVGMNFEKLEAKEQSILAGVSVTLKNVKINGNIRDLHVYRWFLITENEEVFYVAEIAYSPESTGSIQVWEELREMMKSFRIIEK